MKTMQNILMGTLLLGATALQTGCVDAAGTMRILRNQSPGDECVVSNEETSLFLSSGIIDVNAGSGYLFTPLVESRAVSSGNSDRRVFLDGAIVKLKFAEGLFDEATTEQLETDGLSYFTQPISGSIEADGGTTAFSFEILPISVLAAIKLELEAGEVTRVFAEIELQGEVDGSDISSPTFTYPIEVCDGCLYQDLGSCAALPEDSANIGGSCQLGQDGYVDCCTTTTGSVLCPAVVEEI